MAPQEHRPVQVDLAQGRLRGNRIGSVHEFLGIPYAKASRFRPAVPFPSWGAVRAARSFGPAPSQPENGRARLFQGPVGPTAEDCLTLNVWAPGDADRLPVLVWVHGGAFGSGAGSVPALRGRHLAGTARLIVVTVSYRLGAFGFATHESLTGAGNLGLGDLLVALRWVRDSIARFGGDPERVTLGGESAGSMCAALLSVLPTAHDLFHKVVLHSGIPRLQPAQEAQQTVEALADRLGTTVSDLHDAPADRIIAATREIGPHHWFWPTATADLAAPLADLQAQAPKRPTLVSTTSDEGTFFFVEDSAPRRVGRAEALAALAAALPGGAEARYARTADELGDDDPLTVASAVITRELFEAPAAEWSHRAAAAGSAVYRARYARPSPLWDGWLGATHTIDIPVLFGTFDDPALSVLYRGDSDVAAMSATVQALWGRFIHTGAPWPAWSPESGHVEQLTAPSE